MYVTGLRDSRSKLVSRRIGIALDNRDIFHKVTQDTGGAHTCPPIMTALVVGNVFLFGSCYETAPALGSARGGFSVPPYCRCSSTATREALFPRRGAISLPERI